MLQFFSISASGGAVAQLGARLDGIEEVVGSNPIGSTIFETKPGGLSLFRYGSKTLSTQLKTNQLRPGRRWLFTSTFVVAPPVRFSDMLWNIARRMVSKG